MFIVPPRACRQLIFIIYYGDRPPLECADNSGSVFGPALSYCTVEGVFIAAQDNGFNVFLTRAV